MKFAPRLLAALAIVALVCCATTVQAQSGYNNGYGFGLGFGLGNGFPYPGEHCQNGNGFNPGFVPFGGFGLAPRVDEPPYFAKFPPVYYSEIVRRPYGISPYAAPAGILPAEMQPAAQPVRILNPHFEGDAIETAPPVSPIPSTIEVPLPSAPMLILPDSAAPAVEIAPESNGKTGVDSAAPASDSVDSAPSETKKEASAKPKSKRIKKDL